MNDQYNTNQTPNHNFSGQKTADDQINQPPLPTPPFPSQPTPDIQTPNIDGGQAPAVETAPAFPAGDLPAPAFPDQIPAPAPPLAEAPSQPLSVQEPGFTQEPLKKISWQAWAKLLYLVFFVCLIFTAGYFLLPHLAINLPVIPSDIQGDILLQTRYQPVLWKDFGEVFEPIIKMPVFYSSQGYQNISFLLDSGALVSSLPRDEAEKMGISLAKLPRSTFGGFGNTTSFAYKSEIKIKLSDEELVIPAVFTEAAGTKPILGRAGFFEDFNIYFNSKAQKIEIRKL